MLINAKGTEIVIDECRRAGIKRLLYASSVSVVWNGGKEAWNMDESAPYLEKVRTTKRCALGIYAQTANVFQ